MIPAQSSTYLNQFVISHFFMIREIKILPKIFKVFHHYRIRQTFLQYYNKFLHLFMHPALKLKVIFFKCCLQYPFLSLFICTVNLLLIYYPYGSFCTYICVHICNFILYKFWFYLFLCSLIFVLDLLFAQNKTFIK